MGKERDEQTINLGRNFPLCKEYSCRHTCDVTVSVAVGRCVRASAAAVGEPQYSATRAKVKTWRCVSRLVHASFLTMYLLECILRVARLAVFMAK